MDCVRRRGATAFDVALDLVLARVLASLSVSELKNRLTLEAADPMKSRYFRNAENLISKVRNKKMERSCESNRGNNSAGGNYFEKE